MTGRSGLRIYLRVGRKSYSARDLIRPTAIRPSLDQSALVPRLPAAITPEWLTKEEMAGRLNLNVRAFGDLVRDHRNLPRRVYSQKMMRFDPVKFEAFLDKFNVGEGK